MRQIFKKIVTNILVLEARAVLRKYKPSIVAVTGSVGKTTTKEAIYSALAERSFVRKSDKSFNSEIGVPLTILGCPNGWNNPLRWLENIFDGLLRIFFNSKYPEWLVLEIGADRPGDIRAMASWLSIDVAVVTHIPEVPVHVEYFASPEEVVEEKAAIISAMKPSGTLVLYADDQRVLSLADRAHQSRVITYGLEERANVRATNTEIVYSDAATHQAQVPIGMRASVISNLPDAGGSLEVFIDGTLGTHVIVPFLAAASVASAIGMPIATAAESFKKNQEPVRGRMRILAGIRGSIIIDDTYNASPAATTAALQVLRDLKVTGKKIAVLGDMMELGRYSVESHKKIGAQVAEIADEFMTVGIRMRDAAQAALDAGMQDSSIFQYERSEQAGEALVQRIAEGDCVLLKGSQSIRMERAVELLLADPTKARDLLVRKEPEWLSR